MSAKTGDGRADSALQPGSLREALARDIVACIAPDELPVVAAYARQRPSLVARRLRSRRHRRDPLAFGIEASVGLVSPLVWLAVNEAVRRMGANAGEGVSKRLARAMRRLSRRKLGQSDQPPSPEVITFTREQLAVVHATAVKSAARHGVGSRKGAVMADTIVAALAIANAPAIDASEAPRPLETGGGPEAGGTRRQGS
ncbi:hypothetical protein [Streptacidiphilus fuscans]|uniref:Uncharacterized protein n=1 Tax=Streptacidiphilus fuscans TaxID=2789292 RepID=A0A931B3H4_9ACTN|nr:hypothetical protein [Streptacidiphilus fuscans]MBF9067268.1 hypothetical protein [Streptacidiphilus fuscans]